MENFVKNEKLVLYLISQVHFPSSYNLIQLCFSNYSQKRRDLSLLSNARHSSNFIILTLTAVSILTIALSPQQRVTLLSVINIFVLASMTLS